MDFSQQLQNAKIGLKNVSSVVRYPDGRSFLESRGQNTEIESTVGYVIDTKPDDIPSRITENIYLGSQDCSELEVVTKYNIKHVLSLGVKPFSFAVNHRFVKCLDLPETNILDILQHQCYYFISNAVKLKENVLVHCAAGVSRSSSIVIGYLMVTEKLSYEDAFKFVKSKRSCIKPNCGFENQLKGLEFTEMYF
ncbi:hypothetical protein PPYR_12292 [Photinus pyralis]|uniref:Dual specificity protein phosphatase 19 n=1 Tax=Photinus pyralis TaxID=7054 RepID=A0A1Y1L491_PHOPY|nr:dual specificity protein phosphatase 19 [Photinus pyralis]KAB0795453.1 hypothetical protein PPYR_12292 [Photinus pyralis]